MNEYCMIETASDNKDEKDEHDTNTSDNENTNNINSLKVFLVGENQIEENTSPLAVQIQNLQNLIGASSLEGEHSLLERIISLENEIASLKGENVTK